MKKIALLVCLAFIGCSHKEDTPAPSVPHVAGMWSGNGTDDAIGYYNWAINIDQSNSDAAGTFDTSGGYGTTHGNISLCFGPQGNGNLTFLTMTRTAGTICSGTAALNGIASITSSDISFRYTVTDCRGTNTGGANLHKIAGTN